MLLRSLQGDDEINDTLTGAMHATVLAMIRDKVIDEDKGTEFLKNHICFLAHENAFRRWFKLIGGAAKESRIVVAEVKA